MQVINDRLQLPKEYNMIQIAGKTEAERIENAKKIAATHEGEAWYIEKKDYNASGAYLFLVKPQKL